MFIRKSEDTKTDEKLFQILNWNDYKVIDDYTSNDLDCFSSFCFTECDNWIHLIDSIWCALWYKIYSNPKELSQFENLEISDEIFGFFYHDEVDAEYVFFYIKNGKLIRHYRLYEPPGDRWKVFNDMGDAMPGENENCKGENGIEHLSPIFEALNIKPDVSLKRARLYTFEDGFRR